MASLLTVKKESSLSSSAFIAEKPFKKESIPLCSLSLEQLKKFFDLFTWIFNNDYCFKDLFAGWEIYESAKGKHGIMITPSLNVGAKFKGSVIAFQKARLELIQVLGREKLHPFILLVHSRTCEKSPIKEGASKEEVPLYPYIEVVYKTLDGNNFDEAFQMLADVTGYSSRDLPSRISRKRPREKRALIIAYEPPIRLMAPEGAAPQPAAVDS